MNLLSLRLCRRTVRKGSAFPERNIFLFLEALPPESEAQPPATFRLTGKAEPYRTVRRQRRKNFLSGA
jgi:hypothetical protein